MNESTRYRYQQKIQELQEEVYRLKAYEIFSRDVIDGALECLRQKEVVLSVETVMRRARLYLFR